MKKILCLYGKLWVQNNYFQLKNLKINVSLPAVFFPNLLCNLYWTKLHRRRLLSKEVVIIVKQWLHKLDNLSSSNISESIMCLAVKNPASNVKLENDNYFLLIFFHHCFYKIHDKSRKFHIFYHDRLTNRFCGNLLNK